MLTTEFSVLEQLEVYLRFEMWRDQSCGLCGGRGRVFVLKVKGTSS